MGAYFSQPFIERPGGRESSHIRPFGNGLGFYVEGLGKDGLKPNKVPQYTLPGMSI
jgi:hypothetical protein